MAVAPQSVGMYQTPSSSLKTSDARNCGSSLSKFGIFDVSQGGADDRPLKGLDRVARLVNMLAAGGVDADQRQIVVVLHGAATPAVLSDAAWAARGKGDANPNSALIRSLIAAGVPCTLTRYYGQIHGFFSMSECV